MLSTGKAYIFFNLILNLFYFFNIFRSDNRFGANKDRDIFQFPIPQKVPDFKFDKFLISKEMLMKFLHPPHLEHSNVQKCY